MNGKGRPYRGRRCAEKVSPAFRRMQADMHNLFPAIGAVNAARSNYAMQMLPDVPPTFGTCAVRIARRKVEPPDAAKGTVARALLYMASLSDLPPQRFSAKAVPGLGQALSARWLGMRTRTPHCAAAGQ